MYLCICICLIGIGLSLILSVGIGSVHYSWSSVFSILRHHLGGAELSGDITQAADTIIWQLRVPRAILALTVGAGLAIAGVDMQALVRNPLAEPYLLGIASGASVGATAVLVFGVIGGINALFIGSLVGAIAASITVYLIARMQGDLNPLRLILSGVVLSSAFSAVASFLVFRGPDSRAAESVMFWMLGSVAGATWAKLPIPIITVILAFILMRFLSRPMDAIASGDETAISVGVDVRTMRAILFLIQAVLVGIMVAIAGGIGFVGLVIPHLARTLVGAVHSRLIPTAAVMGALFMLWVDVIARIAAPPQEIPLGVVTGIIGAPLFLILMGRKELR
ncbi:MAG: iron ABC transporter permease [Corynebacterium sp.]|nr:iron ABC transporter permease [Corynebacterium sp.]